MSPPELPFPRAATLCVTSSHLLDYVDLHGTLYVLRLILQQNEKLGIESKASVKYEASQVKNVQCITHEQHGTKDYSLKIYNGRGDVCDLTLEVAEV